MQRARPYRPGSKYMSTIHPRLTSSYIGPTLMLRFQHQPPSHTSLLQSLVSAPCVGQR